MGSFNVACTVSRISIGPGDPVAFFILLPNVYGNRQHLVGANSMLIYANCYFNPLGLPVFGEYNDYGGMENIVEDANTRALEAFFGISIGDIIESVTCGRDPADSYSASYAVDGLKDGLFDYAVPFDGEWLERLDFCEVSYGPPQAKDARPEPLYINSDYRYYVRAFKEQRQTPDGSSYDTDAFEIWNDSGLLVASGDNFPKKKFLESFHDLTGRWLHMPLEAHDRTEILQRASGMWVHRDIYYALAASPVESYGKEPAVADARVTEDQLRAFGFEEVPKEVQYCRDPHHSALWRKKGYPFDIKWGRYGCVIIHQDYKEYYTFGDVKNFSVDEVRREWEAMTGTSPEKTFPEPENEKAPTDEERAAICFRFAELTDGGTLGWAEERDAKMDRSVYSLRRFVARWEIFTGDVLDLETYESTSKHQQGFDDLSRALQEYDAKEPEVTIYKYPSLEEQQANHERGEKYRATMAEARGKKYKPQPFEPKPPGEEYEYVRDTSFDDPLGYFRTQDSDFIPFYKDWKYFKEIYREPIKQGDEDLKLAFDAYHAFYLSMYSCNVHFFPAMNGEQCGNHQESRNLLIASLRVIEAKLGEQNSSLLESIAWEADYYGDVKDILRKRLKRAGSNTKKKKKAKKKAAKKKTTKKKITKKPSKKKTTTKKTKKKTKKKDLRP